MAVIFLWRACGAGTEVAQFRLNLSARADRDYASLLAPRLKGIRRENEKFRFVVPGEWTWIYQSVV